MDNLAKLIVITLLAATSFMPSAARAASLAYIANFGDDTVTVVDLDTWAVLATIPVGTQPVNIAIDPSRPRVYVTNYASGVSGAGSVSVIDSKLNTVVETVGIGLGGPYAISINPSGSKIYVGNDADKTLTAIDTATRSSTTLFSGLTEIRGIAFDATRIYFTRFTFNVVEVTPETAPSISSLTNMQESGAFGIATDSTNVYWTDYNSGLIRARALGGGGIAGATLVPTQAQASALALDTNSVYWITNSAGGSLLKFAKNGTGSVATLLSGLASVTGVAVDANYAYVTETGNNALVRVPVAGGTAQRVTVGSQPYSTSNFVGDNTGNSDSASVVLDSDKSFAEPGDSISFTALMAGLPSGGTMRFCDGGAANDTRFCSIGTIVCDSVPVIEPGNDAVCTTSALAVGTHHLTAQYRVADISATTPTVLGLRIDQIFTNGFELSD